MQFLPGTFTAWAVDADGDGAADPHDIDDAVATPPTTLCGGRGGKVDDERVALRRYNADVEWVLTVAASLGWSGGGSIVCPVAGPTTFTRLVAGAAIGGRQHKGVDMFAAEGTPVVAPIAGDVEFRSDELGGLAFHLWGDDGAYYYGAQPRPVRSRPRSYGGRIGLGIRRAYGECGGNAAPPSFRDSSGSVPRCTCGRGESETDRCRCLSCAIRRCGWTVGRRHIRGGLVPCTAVADTGGRAAQRAPFPGL